MGKKIKEMKAEGENSGLMEKVKKFLFVDDENPENVPAQQLPLQPVADENTADQPKSRAKEKAEKKNNVVSFENGKATLKNVGDSQVVIKMIVSVDEVGSVADILKENRIVVLNLETCPVETMQRIIDILYGVAYALDGTFNPIGDKVFVIAPCGVSVESIELDEEAEPEE